MSLNSDIKALEEELKSILDLQNDIYDCMLKTNRRLEKIGLEKEYIYKKKKRLKKKHHLHSGFQRQIADAEEDMAKGYQEWLNEYADIYIEMLCLLDVQSQILVNVFNCLKKGVPIQEIDMINALLSERKQVYANFERLTQEIEIITEEKKRQISADTYTAQLEIEKNLAKEKREDRKKIRRILTGLAITCIILPVIPVLVFAILSTAAVTIGIPFALVKGMQFLYRELNSKHAIDDMKPEEKDNSAPDQGPHNSAPDQGPDNSAPDQGPNKNEKRKPGKIYRTPTSFDQKFGKDPSPNALLMLPPSQIGFFEPKKDTHEHEDVSPLEFIRVDIK